MDEKVRNFPNPDPMPFIQENAELQKQIRAALNRIVNALTATYKPEGAWLAFYELNRRHSGDLAAMADRAELMAGGPPND